MCWDGPGDALYTSFTFSTHTHTHLTNTSWYSSQPPSLSPCTTIARDTCVPLHSPTLFLLFPSLPSTLSSLSPPLPLPCPRLLLSPPPLQLPVAIYESLIDIVDGKPRVVFSRVPYSLATEEAERVGVDHIAKETVATGTHTSAVTDHLSVHYGAIRMLHTRIQFVVDYLRAVQSGA